MVEGPLEGRRNSHVSCPRLVIPAWAARAKAANQSHVQEILLQRNANQQGQDALLAMSVEIKSLRYELPISFASVGSFSLVSNGQACARLAPGSWVEERLIPRRVARK